MAITGQLTAHEAVASAAKEWAGAWYEEASKDNSMYHLVMRRLFRNQEDFIAKCWGQFIPLARAALAKELGNKNVPDKVKNEIYEALLLDKMLPRPANFIDPLLSGGSGAVH